ncbi:MAG: hypothetical protein A3K19_32870 [Lentisphaerae bacterium RIFOXYB12_FULL_65_16]|nr:MAG: hypothetical protein A3K18_21080 [Lentisphaerae bacterium RIFOXYA12_64_32]OGV93508.1 MAG: hypothetical protein A3K19_32870 [Lentisphaerae bacterium RIFOXYB12_FULL_65_16]
MFVILILALSALLQFAATFCALRLARVTGRTYAWIFIAVALFLMGVRRLIPLFHLVSATPGYTVDPANEWVGLALSLLLFLGLMGLEPVLAGRQRAGEVQGKSRDRLARINECLVGLGANYLTNVERLTRLCGEQLGATCALYNRLDKGMLCSLGTWQTPPDYVPTDKPDGHICYDVIQKPGTAAVVIRDLASTPYATTDPNVAKYGLKTYIGVAVRCGGEAVGSLCAVFQAPVDLSEEDQQVLSIIATALGAEENRRRALGALQESEARYRAQFEQAGDYFLVFEADRHGAPVIIDANEKALSAHGYSREELLGKPIAFLDPEVSPDAISQRARALESEGVALFNTRHRRRDGSFFDVEVRVTLVRVGEKTIMLSAERDTTERNRAAEALRRSEERFRLVFENSPVSLWEEDFSAVKALLDALREKGITDIDAYFRQHPEVVQQCAEQVRIADVNPASLVLHGATSKEDLLAGLTKTFTHESYVAFQRELVAIWNGKTEMVSDAVVRTLSGEPRQVIVQWSVCPGHKKTFSKVVVSLTDVTERNRAEAAVRESETRYRTLFEQSGDYIMLMEVGADGVPVIAEANEAAAQAHGYSRDELLGKPINFLDPDAAPDAHKERIAALVSGNLAMFTVQHRRKDGSLFEVEVRAQAVRLGPKLVIVSSERDITERKRVERALRENEARLKEAQRLGRFGSWDWDAQTDTITWSEEYYRVYGIDPRQRPPGYEEHLKAYTPESAARLDAAVKRSMQSGEPYELDLELADTTGPCRWVTARSETKRDEEGRIVGLRGTAQDITERKRAEAEHGGLQAQLLQVQKLEAIGTLAGGIAHDFNNILQGIVWGIETSLRKAADRPEIRERLEAVLHHALRAADLVRQILTFSRRNLPQREPLALQPLVKEAVNLLRASVPASIEVRLRTEGPPVTVTADPTQMHQVLMNLSTNAVHAMEEHGGVLSIGLGAVTLAEKAAMAFPGLAPGPYVELTVSDTGTGIRPEIMGNIFDPFFTTKEQGKGTGLGLAVVHGIVRSHGGAIGVDSTVGKGTTFRVLLPPAEASSPSTKPTTGPALGGNERILFVEDEQVLANYGRDVLEEHGYSVTTSMSGLEALELFRQSPDHFDLVITDQGMPHLSGSELARRLLAIRPNLPIILYSGSAETISATSLGELNIRAILAKPCSPEQMATTVRNVLDAV